MSWLRRAFDRVRAWWSGLWLERAASRFAACLESDGLEDFVPLLFQVMRFALLVDRRYRRNLDGYDVSFVFQRKHGLAPTTVIFAAGCVQVQPGSIADPDVTVTYEHNKALAQFLFGERRDLIGSIVDDELCCVGNPNHLLKLAYMAKHLQLKFASAKAREPLASVARIRLTRWRGRSLGARVGPATARP